MRIYGDKPCYIFVMVLDHGLVKCKSDKLILSLYEMHLPGEAVGDTEGQLVSFWRLA